MRFAPESLALFVDLLNRAHIQVGERVLVFEATQLVRGQAQIEVTEVEIVP